MFRTALRCPSSGQIWGLRWSVCFKYSQYKTAGFNCLFIKFYDIYRHVLLLFAIILSGFWLIQFPRCVYYLLPIIELPGVWVTRNESLGYKLYNKIQGTLRRGGRYTHLAMIFDEWVFVVFRTSYVFINTSPPAPSAATPTRANIFQSSLKCVVLFLLGYCVSFFFPSRTFSLHKGEYSIWPEGSWLFRLCRNSSLFSGHCGKTNASVFPRKSAY